MPDKKKDKKELLIQAVRVMGAQKAKVRTGKNAGSVAGKAAKGDTGSTAGAIAGKRASQFHPGFQQASQRRLEQLKRQQEISNEPVKQKRR